MAKKRSPFGELLRVHRLRHGFSQAALASHIADLGNHDPAVAALGVISAKGIANHERAYDDPGRWVRPQPATVTLLTLVFGLEPTSEDGAAFYEAAETTRRRGAPDAHGNPPHRDTSPALRASKTTFVIEGREEPLARLQRGLREALAGHARVMLLSGEAGIGKTELLAELCREGERVDPRLVVAWGECTGGAGATDPYQPFRQAVSLLLGDIDAASAAQLCSPQTPARLSDRAAEMIEALVTLGSDLIGPYVAEETVRARAAALNLADEAWLHRLHRILASRSSPGAHGAGRLDQVDRVLRRYAAQGPLILVLEDLHWADEGTCALLFHLVRRLRGATSIPLLIVGSFRDTDLVPPKPLARHPLLPVINELRLVGDDALIDLSSTIGNAHGRAFIDGLLHREHNDLDTRFRDLLFARTEGHALFTVELLRWFRQQGSVAHDAEGRWGVVAGADRGEIPTSIEAVIAERLDRLPPNLRRVLEAASVQGDIVTAEVVARVLKLPGHALPHLLDEQLVRRHRLLVLGATTTVAGGRLHQYQFGHALVREQLYRDLPAMERERLHTATAAALAAIDDADGQEHAAEIAFHLEQAGDLDSAARFYKTAGDHALDIVQPEVAERRYLRTIELGDERRAPEVVGEALIGVAASLRQRGKHDEAMDGCAAAAALARRTQSRTVEAHATILFGLLHYDVGQHVEAESRLRSALALLRPLAEPEQECATEALLSHACYGQAKYEAALHHAQRSLRLARRIGNGRAVAEALLAAGNCFADLGFYLRAIAAHEAAIEARRTIDDLRGEIVSLLNIALCHLTRQQWDRAGTTLAAAAERSDHLEVPRIKGMAAMYTGLWQEGQAQLDAAWLSYASARALRQQLGQRALAIDCSAGLLRVALAKPDPDTARQLAGEITTQLDDHGVEGIEDPIRVYVTCIEARRALGEPHAAETLLAAANHLLRERAERIQSDTARHSYLHNVPVNNALRALTPRGQPPTRSGADGSEQTERTADAKSWSVAADYITGAMPS